MMYLRTALLGSLLLCTVAQAAPQHALTLYNEPPKYPADFKHFDYVNPDAPQGRHVPRVGHGRLRQPQPLHQQRCAGR